MSLELRTITGLAGLKAVTDPWRELAGQSANGGPLFRAPIWLLPWWHAYHRVLDAALMVVAGFAGGRLVALAPFYTRVARREPRLKLKEIRLLGDAGPRPPALDLLVEPSFEEEFGTLLAQHLTEASGDWDVIDLQPLQEPSRARAFMTNGLGTSGFTCESAEAGGARRLVLSVPGLESGVVFGGDNDPRIRHYADDVGSLRKGLAALRRLSRLEWADREEASPLADQEASHFLEQVTVELGTAGLARLSRLDDSDNEAIAAALVVDDGDRAVMLATAVDPERPGAAGRLLEAEVRAALARGRVALDVVTGADEVELPALPADRKSVV